MTAQDAPNLCFSNPKRSFVPPVGCDLQGSVCFIKALQAEKSNQIQPNSVKAVRKLVNHDLYPLNN